MKRNITGLFVFLFVILLGIGFNGGISDVLGADKSVSRSSGKKETIEYKKVFPGVYDEEEQELLDITKEFLSGSPDELAKKLEAQLAGKKQVHILGGKKQEINMELHSGVPLADTTLEIDDMISKGKILNPGNPLYTDPEYAKKTRYGGLILSPFAVAIGPSFAYLPKGTDIWIPSVEPTILRGLDHEVTYYKPVYAGDHVKTILTKQEMVDISDPGGSTMRKFRSIGESEVYNQKGEKVMSGIYRGVETYKLFKDRSMMAYYDGPTSIAWGTYSNPDRKKPRHVYTDADWEKIKEIWRNEYIRGSKTLYWEDVNIGDEPVWTCDGPMGETSVVSGKKVSLREVMMNPKAYEDVELYKDSYGIYHIKGDETGAAPPGGQGGMPPSGQMGNPPGGQMGTPPGQMGTPPGGQRGGASGVSISAPLAGAGVRMGGSEYAAKFLNNWKGDDGWLYKIAWHVAFRWDAGLRNMYPADSDRPSYLLKVPYLKEQGRFTDSHAEIGDMSITKGYVCEKYVENGKHYVGLVVWSEDIEGGIWCECYAVVELPSRN